MGGRGGFHRGSSVVAFGAGVTAAAGARAEASDLAEARPRARSGSPLPSLGRLAKDRKIKSLEVIYLFCLPIKGSEIIDFFSGASLKDEVLKIMPMQKETCAGQRTRFKAFIAIWDYNGHVCLGVKCSMEVATAIRGAIVLAKLSIVPKRLLGGTRSASPTQFLARWLATVALCWCSSSLPPGALASSGPCAQEATADGWHRQLLHFCQGLHRHPGNFAKATFDAISKTYSYLTPLKREVFTRSPYLEFTDHLVKTHTRVSMQRTQAPAVATT